MRLLAAAACLAAATLLAQPAAAQFGGAGKNVSAAEIEEKQRQRARQEIERQYQDTVKRRQNTPADLTNDPWANIRSAPSPSQSR